MILVVTCLPRSGSTMMMRMLYRGGMNVVCDNLTSFEDHRVTELPDNMRWLPECEGKAVKVLHPLRYRLPHGPEYKFIFMTRDPREILRSQAKFLTGMRDKNTNRTPRETKQYMWEAYEFLKRYPKSSIIKVAFEDVLSNPVAESQRIVCELDLDLNVDNMASAVFKRDPECAPTMLEFDFKEED